MARCGCSGGTCSCLVTAGAGIAVSGTGTGANPYVIDVSGTAISGTLAVEDTATVDLTLAGAGTTASPYRLSARTTLTLDDLVPGDQPQAGDVPVWDGNQWQFAPPPTTPPGAVNIGAGLVGDGSAASPVALNPSGTWGAPPLDKYGPDPAAGAEVYIDAAGQVRTRPPGVSVVANTNARPNQYVGRVYVTQDTFDTAWSDGQAWHPFAVASPEMLPVPRWKSYLAANGTVVNQGTAFINYSVTSASAFRHDPMGHLEYQEVLGEGRLVALVSGFYWVQASLVWQWVAAGTRKLSIFPSTQTSALYTSESSGTTSQQVGAGVAHIVSGPVSLNVGDYLRIQVINTTTAAATYLSGGGGTGTSAAAMPSLDVYKIGSNSRKLYTP